MDLTPRQVPASDRGLGQEGAPSARTRGRVHHSGVTFAEPRDVPKVIRIPPIGHPHFHSLTLISCRRLNVWVCPLPLTQIHTLKPNPRCNICHHFGGGGLWGVIRSRGWSLHEGYQCLYKGISREITHPSPNVRTQRWSPGSEPGRRFSLNAESANTLILDFPAFEI